MKHLVAIIFLLIVSFLLCSCKKSIPYVNGKTISYYDNGNKKSVDNYVDGKLDGESVSYFEDGATERICNFRNDCLVSLTSYYNNGQKKFVGHYVDKQVLTADERFKFYKEYGEFVDENELTNVKFYEENGEIGYEVTVDNSKLFNRFYKKDFNADAYFINKHIIPFDDYIKASIKSVAERRSLLGKPDILETLPGEELYEMVLLGPAWSWRKGYNRQAIVTFSSIEGSENVRSFKIEIDKEAESIKKLIENTVKYFDNQGYKYVKSYPITYSKKFDEWNAEVILGQSDGVPEYSVKVDKSKK